MSDLDLAIPVDPGSHHVTAAAPGHMSWNLNIDVTDSTTKEVTINLLMISPPPSTKRYSTGMMAGGIVLTVLGGMGVTGGIITTAVNPFIIVIGLGVMGGSVGALLIPGIVLTAVGAHKVPVKDALRTHEPVLVFGPSYTGIKVSF